MAGATIGVSHLVQATRAGADFGFQLLLLVIIVNILKYPFFEFGHRYYAATKNNLLVGYQKLGKFYLATFFFLNIISALAALTALSFVTAGALANIIPYNINITMLMGLVYFSCIVLLYSGKYNLLENAIKLMLGVMVVFTVFATLVAIFSTESTASANNNTPWDINYLPFIIALMGWMPGPIEVSVWQSLWIEEKEKISKKQGVFKLIKMDFNLGYGLSVTMAIIFLGLGALTLNTNNIQLSNSSTIFIGQIISMYETTLGKFIGIVMTGAIFATLYSTVMTIVDGYPRSIIIAFELLKNKKINKKSNINKKTYTLATIYGMASILIVSCFSKNLKTIVDIATIIAFLTAPIFAIMNYKLIYDKSIKNYYKPGIFITFLSWVGILYLTLFSVYYIYFLIF